MFRSVLPRAAAAGAHAFSTAGTPSVPPPTGARVPASAPPTSAPPPPPPVPPPTPKGFVRRASPVLLTVGTGFFLYRIVTDNDFREDVEKTFPSIASLLARIPKTDPRPLARDAAARASSSDPDAGSTLPAGYENVPSLLRKIEESKASPSNGTDGIETPIPSTPRFEAKAPPSSENSNLAKMTPAQRSDAMTRNDNTATIGDGHILSPQKTASPPVHSGRPGPGRTPTKIYSDAAKEAPLEVGPLLADVMAPVDKDGYDADSARNARGIGTTATGKGKLERILGKGNFHPETLGRVDVIDDSVYEEPAAWTFGSQEKSTRRAAKSRGEKPVRFQGSDDQKSWASGLLVNEHSTELYEPGTKSAWTAAPPRSKKPVRSDMSTSQNAPASGVLVNEHSAEMYEPGTESAWTAAPPQTKKPERHVGSGNQGVRTSGLLVNEHSPEMYEPGTKSAWTAASPKTKKPERHDEPGNHGMHPSSLLVNDHSPEMYEPGTKSAWTAAPPKSKKPVGNDESGNQESHTSGLLVNEHSTDTYEPGTKSAWTAAPPKSKKSVEKDESGNQESRTSGLLVNEHSADTYEPGTKSAWTAAPPRSKNSMKSNDSETQGSHASGLLVSEHSSEMYEPNTKSAWTAAPPERKELSRSSEPDNKESRGAGLLVNEHSTELYEPGTKSAWTAAPPKSKKLVKSVELETEESRASGLLVNEHSAELYEPGTKSAWTAAPPKGDSAPSRGGADGNLGRSGRQTRNGTIALSDSEILALQAELESQAKWEGVRLQEAVRAQMVEDKKNAAREAAAVARKHEEELARLREEAAAETRRALRDKTIELKTKVEAERDADLKRMLKHKEEDLRDTIELEYADRERRGAAAVEKALSEARAEVEALSGQFDAIVTQTERAKEAAKRASVAFLLQQNVSGSLPISEQLAGAGGGTTLGATVTESVPASAAEKGIESVDDLRSNFAQVSKRGLSVAMVPEGSSSSIWGHMLGAIFSRVKIPVDNREDDLTVPPSSNEERLRRAVLQVKEGDIGGAVVTLEGLEGLSAEVMADWIAAAKARIAANLAAEVLLADAIVTQVALSGDEESSGKQDAK